MIAGLLSLAIISLGQPLAERTSFVRQFAKDAPNVYIVYATPNALEGATSLRRLIINHKDLNSKKRVEVVSPEEASVVALQDDKFKDSVVVTLFAQPKDFLPQRMQDFVVLDSDELKGTTSKMRSVRTRDADKGLAFKVSLYAPDPERLKRLVDEFTDRMFDNWKDMRVDDSFRSYKLIRYGAPPQRDVLERWGRTPAEWVYTETKSLSDFQYGFTDGDPEFDRCVMVDRSQDNVGDELDRNFGISISKRTEQFARKKQLPNGRWLAAIVAPDAEHLRRVADLYNSIDAIPTEGYRQELADLSGVGQTALVLYSRDSSLDLERLRSGLETMIATSTKRNLVPIAGSADAIRELIFGRSGQSAAKGIRDAKIKHVWVLDVPSVSRSTSYNVGQNQITSDPGMPPEPRRPYRGEYPKGASGDVQYVDATLRYRRDHAQWENDVDYYRYRAPVIYEQRLSKSQAAEVTATLALYEIQGDQLKVVWTTNGAGYKTKNQMVSSNTSTASGFSGSRPSLPSTPPTESTCDFDLVDSAVNASLDRCLDQTLANCLLTGGTRVETLPTSNPGRKETVAKAPEPSTSTPPPPASKKIIELRQNRIVVNIGSRAKVRRGDKMLAVFKWEFVKGAWKPVDYIVYRVATVSAYSSNCTLVNAKDKTRQHQLRLGQAVAWYKRDA